MISIYEKTPVTLKTPEFKGRLLYMHKTSLKEPEMNDEFADYQQTIQDILSRIQNKKGVCYITIDEKIVNNSTHRRPGLHVDFNWYENLKAHGNSDGGRHTPGPMSSPAHHPAPESPGHRPAFIPGAHGISGHDSHRGNFDHDNYHGGMLLAATHSGCRVFRGEFDGEVSEEGDCSLVDVSNLEQEVMEPNFVYFINALGIHEPLVIKGPVNRQLVRINFHPDYIWEGVA